MASLTPHARSNSIKRTPSDLSQALANVDLPAPSMITSPTIRTESQFHNDEEVLVMKHRRNESDRAQEAMIDKISTLALPEPEFVLKAAAVVDGTTVTSTSTAIAQEVTPWDVTGAVVDGVQMAIDYDHLINQFGTKKIDQALLDRFERLTGRQPHLLLRRGTFFSHRELDKILDLYEAGKLFYLYTGRGPSSDSMHLGHMIPFIFTQWLQDVFDVPLVVQLTDDEKFLFKPNLKLEQCNTFAFANARDVIACGFKLEKTFIFSDLDFVGGAFYRNVVSISRLITARQSQQTFGFDLSDNVGKWHFVAVQAAPSISSSFPQIFGTNAKVPCLIPCAIDQDPYFRLTREVSTKLKLPKPSLIHAKFIPSLLGSQSKMSASSESSGIFMSDTEKNIKNKINKYAFSGGGATVEDHQRDGGNPDVDVSFQYLTFFMEDDVELKRIETEYRSGRMLTSELKAITISLIQEFVKGFQSRKAAVSDEIVKEFMNASRVIDPVSSKPSKVDPLSKLVKK